MFAAAWPELRVVAECEDGPAAVEALEPHAPQVAFLDIRMNGMNGMDVARATSGRCHSVFTTAYDSRAVAAFDAGAVDYLLKPIAADRLAQAVARLRERLRGNAAAPDLEQPVQRLAGRLQPGAEPAQRLRWPSASVGDTIRMFAIDGVLFFQSDEKYTASSPPATKPCAHAAARDCRRAAREFPAASPRRHRALQRHRTRAPRRTWPHHAASAPSSRDPGRQPGLGLALQAHLRRLRRSGDCARMGTPQHLQNLCDTAAVVWPWRGAILAAST